MIRPEIQRLIDDLKNNPNKWSLDGGLVMARHTISKEYKDTIQLFISPVDFKTFHLMTIKLWEEENEIFQREATKVYNMLLEKRENEYREGEYKKLTTLISLL